MSDEILMVEGASVFLAGPYLVKAAIGEEVDNETLGGATMHAAVSGTADYKFKTEEECLNYIKSLVSKIALPDTAGFNRIAPKAPAKDVNGIYSIMHENNAKPYDVVQVIEHIVDADSFEQYKEDYVKTIVCGYARIDGWAVGILGNKRVIVR